MSAEPKDEARRMRERQAEDARAAERRAEGPGIEQQDWDAIEGPEVKPESSPQNGDLRYRPGEGEIPGDLPEEDDDNAYQESDEALPDDKEEAALQRDPSKERTKFDEV